MTEVPAAVRSAVEAHHRNYDLGQARSFSDSSARRILRGDLRIVQPPCREGAAGTRRLCLVVGVDSTSEFADIVLVHSAPELATNLDGVIPSSTSGVPYATVVQTDLRGIAWTFQIGSSVGHLDESTLEALSSIALGKPGTERAGGREVWSGSALTGESDRRWAFKTDEGSMFRILTRECTAALIDGSTIWEIDQGLLRRGQLDCATDRPEVFQEFWEWRSTRRSRQLTVSDDLLAEMLAQDLPTPNTESDLAFELATLAWELAAEASTATPADRSDGTRRGLLSVAAVHGPGHGAFDEVHLLGKRLAA